MVIENQANILQKTALQSMSKIRWILIPIWLHFGTVLGPKSEPNWYKIALNIASQDEQQNDTLSDRPKIDFLWILVPKPFQNGGWKCLGFLYIFALGALLGPSWAQDRPRALQEASWDRF